MITERNVACGGIAVLCVAASLYLVVPILRLPLWIPVLPNEGWNALYSSLALGGGRLYPDHDSFLFNNYPPVSFYVVGLAGRLVNDNILAGRLISLAAVGVIAFNIILTVRHLGGTKLFGILAGVLFVGILAKSYVPYVGVNDPQLLAHAIMTSGFAILTARPRSLRHVVCASFLMVLAGFTKHSIFAMPLAVTTWLVQNDRRTLTIWLASSVAFLLIGFTTSWFLYGPAFFQQLLYPRAHSLYNVVVLLGWLQSIIIPLALWAVFAYRAPAEPRIRLVSHLLIAGGIEFVIVRLGDNVGINVLFDWVIGAAIAAGVMLSRIHESALSHRHGPAGTRVLIVAALCLRMVLLPQKDFLELLFRPSDWTDRQNYDAAYRREVAFMRELPGPSVCEDLTLCYRSGHISAYDEINGLGAFALGARDINVLRQQIATRRYPLIELDPPSYLLEAARATGFAEHHGGAGDFIFFGDRP